MDTKRILSSAKRQRWENEVVTQPSGHNLYSKRPNWLKGITTGADSKERFQKVQARTDPAQVGLSVLLGELDLEGKS